MLHLQNANYSNDQPNDQILLESFFHQIKTKTLLYYSLIKGFKYTGVIPFKKQFSW